MKKLLVILMSLMLVLAFVGCDEKTENPSTQPSQTVSEQPSQTASVQPTQQPQVGPAATEDIYAEIASKFESLGEKMGMYKDLDIDITGNLGMTMMGQSLSMRAEANIKIQGVDTKDPLMAGSIQLVGVSNDGPVNGAFYIVDGYAYLDMVDIFGQKIKLPLNFGAQPSPATIAAENQEVPAAVKELIIRNTVIDKTDGYAVVITLEGEDLKTFLTASNAQMSEETEITQITISIALDNDGNFETLSIGLKASSQTVVEGQSYDMDMDLNIGMEINNKPDQSVTVTIPEDLDTYVEGQLPGMGGAELM